MSSNHATLVQDLVSFDNNDMKERDGTNKKRKERDDMVEDEERLTEHVFDDLIESFWLNQMNIEDMTRLAELIQKRIDIPLNTPPAEVIGNLKINIITGKCIEDLFMPLVCEMIYDGSYIHHPYTGIMKQVEDGQFDDKFAGNPPLNHPAPRVFAGNKLHVSFPQDSMHVGHSFRFCELGSSLSESEDEQMKAAKWLTLKFLVKGMDAGIYQDGKKLQKPHSSVIAEAKRVMLADVMLADEELD